VNFIPAKLTNEVGGIPRVLDIAHALPSIRIRVEDLVLTNLHELADFIASIRYTVSDSIAK
jgi:hypothetical protein